MLYIIRFHDNPDVQEPRARFMDDHLKWIEENRSWVLLAGSLRPEHGAPAVGGLWVVDAQTRDEVAERIKTDPFWINGIRKGVDIYAWGMASDDMKLTAADMRLVAKSRLGQFNCG